MEDVVLFLLAMLISGLVIVGVAWVDIIDQKRRARRLDE